MNDVASLQCRFLENNNNNRKATLFFPFFKSHKNSARITEVKNFVDLSSRLLQKKKDFDVTDHVANNINLKHRWCSSVVLIGLYH